MPKIEGTYDLGQLLRGLVIVASLVAAYVVTREQVHVNTNTLKHIAAAQGELDKRTRALEFAQVKNSERLSYIARTITEIKEAVQ